MCKTEKRHRCTEQTLGLCGEEEGGIFRENSIEHVYYQGWNSSPAYVKCMRQVLGAGALGRPRGIGWRGRWEGGSGWGIHVNPWLIHVNVWQKPLQYCKVISLQLIKINENKKKKKICTFQPLSKMFSFILIIVSCWYLACCHCYWYDAQAPGMKAFLMGLRNPGSQALSPSCR